MNVKVLVEDTSASGQYSSEHGLSLYIETPGHKLLFDMGKSRLFLENAGKMGVDLTKVDTGILSHGHYDHGGGLAAFLAANEAADVYASERAFEPHFARRADGRVEFIGVDPEPTANPRLKKVGRALALDEELTLFSGVDAVQNRPPANRTLLMRVAGSYAPDDFAHEQHLIVRENGEDVLFTGCAHGGILNILEAAVRLRGRAPRAVVGGFHLFLKPGEGGDNLDFALRTAEALKRYGAVYYTGHCTGEGGTLALQEALGDRVRRLSTGLQFDI